MTERGVEGNDMSKLGDDLIQSLKEAVAHANGEGSGTEYSLRNDRNPNARKSDTTPDADKPSETTE